MSGPGEPEEPMSGMAGCLSDVKNSLQININEDTEIRRDRPSEGQVAKLRNFLMAGPIWG